MYFFSPLIPKLISASWRQYFSITQERCTFTDNMHEQTHMCIGKEVCLHIPHLHLLLPTHIFALALQGSDFVFWKRLNNYPARTMHAQGMSLAAQRSLSVIFFSWVTEAGRRGEEWKRKKKAGEEDDNSIFLFSTRLQLADILNSMFTGCSLLAHTDCW